MPADPDILLSRSNRRLGLEGDIRLGPIDRPLLLPTAPRGRLNCGIPILGQPAILEGAAKRREYYTPSPKLSPRFKSQLFFKGSVNLPPDLRRECPEERGRPLW
jgi:hypothetical protein